MRLLFKVPTVESKLEERPAACANPRCKSTAIYKWQNVVKKIRDTRVDTVEAQRYRCADCGRTFRAYPTGVTAAQVSARAQALAVMFYLLGLSYGATSIALGGLGIVFSKTLVYYTVQAARTRAPGLRRQDGGSGKKTPVLAADLTTVKVRGRNIVLGLVTDALSGEVLSVDGLDGEDARTLKEWLEPIAEAVGAKLLVTDDADAFKTVADDLGLDQQVCIAHVDRNTDALVDALTGPAGADQDGSLAEIGVTPEQAVADLADLDAMVDRRDPRAAADLAKLHLRYGDARPPTKGERASLAYRLRLLFLDRSELWGRLTRYRTWRGPHGERLDGTNNVSERAIGWWIKERYRPMRGYKVRENAIGVSRLLTHCGNQLKHGGADLALLVAA